jgi:hypothetical protein
MYFRAAAVASDLPEGSWGKITGSYVSTLSTIVWATPNGGTTVLANANYLNLTNGLSGNEIRLNIEDCDSCAFGLVYYCVRGGTPQIATGGWEGKSRTVEIAVGLGIHQADSDFGTISVQERSNNGNVQYRIKFDVTGL